MFEKLRHRFDQDALIKHQRKDPMVDSLARLRSKGDPLGLNQPVNPHRPAAKAEQQPFYKSTFFWGTTSVVVSISLAIIYSDYASPQPVSVKNGTRVASEKNSIGAFVISEASSSAYARQLVLSRHYPLLSDNAKALIDAQGLEWSAGKSDDPRWNEIKYILNRSGAIIDILVCFTDLDGSTQELSGDAKDNLSKAVSQLFQRGYLNPALGADSDESAVRELLGDLVASIRRGSTGEYSCEDSKYNYGPPVISETTLPPDSSTSIPLENNAQGISFDIEPIGISRSFEIT